MKPTTAAIIFFASVLCALLVILSIAIYFNDAIPTHYIDQPSILDLYRWTLRLPTFERFSVLAIIFFLLLFITIDTIFVFWFIFCVQIAERPVNFLQSSYKNLQDRVDDIENLTAFGSPYSKKSTIPNTPRESLDQARKGKSPSSIPSVYFSQETPLRNSLQTSLASVRIATTPYQRGPPARGVRLDVDKDSSSSSSSSDSVKELFFDGAPIEYKMYHGKEVLIL